MTTSVGSAIGWLLLILGGLWLLLTGGCTLVFLVGSIASVFTSPRDALGVITMVTMVGGLAIAPGLAMFLIGRHLRRPRKEP